MKSIFSTYQNYFSENLLNKVSKKIFEMSEIQDFIINNIQDRLENTGVDAFGNRLITDFAKSQGSRSYSKNTKTIKKAKGQNYSNVTLKDTGTFYNSFKIAANNTFYTINANFNKSKNNIFQNFQDSYTDINDFQKSILNLNDNELKIFINEYFIPNFKMIFLNQK